MKSILVKPISDLADIRMGVTFRGRDATRPVPGGTCRMIRISDVSDDGDLLASSLLEFDPKEAVKPDHYLRPGDILFPNRGTRTTAHVFDLPDKNVVVGAQFFVIRPESTDILPEYLAWYLRTDVAAQHFQLRRKGTLVQTIQRMDIGELEVPVPDLERQRIIVELADLGVQEREISVRLAELRTTLLQRQLLSAVHAIS